METMRKTAVALTSWAIGCTAPPAQPLSTAAVDAAPPMQALTPPLISKAGDRLKIRTERGDDGSVRVIDSRYDSKFKEPCETYCGSDGKQHCLPTRAVVIDSYYVDKDCTQRLASVARGRPVSMHAILVSKEDRTGDAYMCEYTKQGRVFKVEGEYRESYIYLKNEKSGSCTRITEKEDATLGGFLKHNAIYAVSAEVSPSEFVTITTSQTADPESDRPSSPGEKK